jgi:hypothetical protein
VRRSPGEPWWSPHRRQHRETFRRRPSRGSRVPGRPGEREPADQIAHRRRRDRGDGGHPPAFDPVRYRDRNVVERSYVLIK